MNASRIGSGDLSVDVSATEGGSAAGIENCSTGELVTVQATPDTGYVFSAWTNSATSLEVCHKERYDFRVFEDTQLVASFVSHCAFILEDSVQGEGEIVVAPNLSAYTCDQPVYLHAVPDIGHRFVRWEGASTSTEAEITLTMDESKEITAVFEPAPREAFGIQIDLDDDGLLDTYTENNHPTAPEYMRLADYRDNGRLISVSPGDDDVQPIQFVFPSNVPLDEITIDIEQPSEGPQLKFYADAEWWWWGAVEATGATGESWEPAHKFQEVIHFPTSLSELPLKSVYAIASNSEDAGATVNATVVLTYQQEEARIPVEFAVVGRIGDLQYFQGVTDYIAETKSKLFLDESEKFLGEITFSGQESETYLLAVLPRATTSLMPVDATAPPDGPMWNIDHVVRKHPDATLIANGILFPSREFPQTLAPRTNGFLVAEGKVGQLSSQRYDAAVLPGLNYYLRKPQGAPIEIGVGLPHIWETLNGITVEVSGQDDNFYGTYKPFDEVGDDWFAHNYSVGVNDWNAFYGLTDGASYGDLPSQDPSSFVAISGEYIVIAMTKISLNNYWHPLDQDLVNFGQRGCAHMIHARLLQSAIAPSQIAKFDGGASASMAVTERFGILRACNRGGRNYAPLVWYKNLGYVNNYVVLHVGPPVE